MEVGKVLVQVVGGDGSVGCVEMGEESKSSGVGVSKYVVAEFVDESGGDGCD
jgi:hypothetical protein